MSVTVLPHSHGTAAKSLQIYLRFIRLKGTFVKNRDMLLPSEATKHSEQKEAATCLQAYCIMGLEYGDINMCQRNFLQDRLSSLLLRTVLC
jgi:hypothetical protein